MLRPLLGVAGAVGGHVAAGGGSRARSLSEPDLERQLLRNSVVRLTAGRAHCSDCGRTPLVGERVHLFADGDVVCELCRRHRSAAPERSETVHHSERGHTVKRRAA